MMDAQGSVRRLAVSFALATLVGSAGTIPSQADPLTVEKDGTVKVEKGLEVGPNGPGINEKGATIRGLNGRNFFQDEEKAGALRVGAAWGIPGIYSQKGDVVVGSQSNKIQLKGDVAANSYIGMGAIPVGAITMWYGDPSTVPDGWVLCDGNNDTPNLLGRFIAGFDRNNPDYSTIGKTGGEAKHKLETNELPEHVHKYGSRLALTGGHSHQWGGLNTTETSGNVVTVGVISEGNPTGQNTERAIATKDPAPHENRPPYSVLAYIMYKGWSLPRGSYRTGCQNITRDGSKLKAQCLMIGGGGWRNAELDLGTCKDGSDISNSGGYLECTRK